MKLQKIIVPVLLLIAIPSYSQKVESIAFHLYTDSLKKGQHNYINVDGKLSNGKWIPLDNKDIVFSCDAAEFKGNELVIPEKFNQEKVKVKAALKDNPSISMEKTIWVKQIPDPMPPTKDEMMKGSKKNKGK